MPLRRAPGAAFGLTRATKGRKAENFRRVHKPKASCTSSESSAIAISPWRMTPSKIGVRFIPGRPLLARSRDHRKVCPAPHPAFGHLLPACGEKEKSRRPSSQPGISAGQPHQERGRALHLGLQYRRPSMRRPISFDGYRCGYGGWCAALRLPHPALAGLCCGSVALRFDHDDDVHAVD
jgi:hypothetical protein